MKAKKTRKAKSSSPPAGEADGSNKKSSGSALIEGFTAEEIQQLRSLTLRAAELPFEKHSRSSKKGRKEDTKKGR